MEMKLLNSKHVIALWWVGLVLCVVVWCDVWPVVMLHCIVLSFTFLLHCIVCIELY